MQNLAPQDLPVDCARLRILSARQATTAPRKPRAAPATDPVPAAATQGGFNMASRQLERAADGHFYADAMVNGARVHFLIDTGASMVALTAADAQRAGIALPSQRMTAMGAGGEIEVIPVTIDRIAIGSLEARNIEGAVARELPVSLLGQSFLEQVGCLSALWVEVRDEVCSEVPHHCSVGEIRDRRTVRKHTRERLFG